MTQHKTQKSMGWCLCSIFLIGLCDAFDSTIKPNDVNLTIEPNDAVKPGAIVNLTATFPLTKRNFESISFSRQESTFAHLLFDYFRRTEANFTAVVEKGSFLCDSPNCSSFFWITIKPGLCDSHNNRTIMFMCDLILADERDMQRYVKLNFQNAQRKLTLDGKEICQNGTQFVNATKTLALKLEVMHETTPIKNLIVNIGHLSFTDFGTVTNEAICDYGALMEINHTFAQNRTIRYSYQAGTSIINESCFITVEKSPPIFNKNVTIHLHWKGLFFVLFVPFIVSVISM